MSVLYPSLPPVDFVQYGKPEGLTFDFAHNLLLEKAREQNVEISTYYMIGDNPEGDIEGANRKGWDSILVRTGLWDGKDNHEKHPAKYVVRDMEEAIEVICSKEGIKFDL